MDPEGQNILFRNQLEQKDLMIQMLSERFRERLSELRVQRYTYFFFCASFSCDFFENGVKKFVFGRCGCLKWCMIRFVLSVDGADNILQERECFCC